MGQPEMSGGGLWCEEFWCSQRESPRAEDSNPSRPSAKGTIVVHRRHRPPGSQLLAVNAITSRRLGPLFQ